MIDILNIEPHKVSTDMSGYSMCVYGDPKIGKTTLACNFPNSLLIAFEAGYKSIPGVKAVPIEKWGDFKTVAKQLITKQARETYKTIIIDTGDVAYEFCSNYILSALGVNDVGEVPYGQGHTKIGKEFNAEMRKICTLGYGLIIISHSKEKIIKPRVGDEYCKIIPTLDSKGLLGVSKLCDFIGYIRKIKNNETGEYERKIFFRDDSDYYMAGSRLAGMPEMVELNYDEILKAISEAIQSQAKESGSQFITDEVVNLYQESEVLDFDAMFKESNDIIFSLRKTFPDDFESFFAPRIVDVAETRLGTGKKISDLKRNQSEILQVILNDLRKMKELTPTK